MTLMTTLLTNVREDVIAYLDSKFTHGAIGRDTTAAVAGDTALGGEVLRKARESSDLTVTGKITTSLKIQTTEGNGNSIAETGWFDAAALLVDGADVTTGWTDSADMTVSQNTSTYVENTLALNLTKDGASTNIPNTCKTVTSRDFTSKKLSLWLYIDDQTTLDLFAVTNCVRIRYGSDATNYYQWDFNKSELAVGWNYLENLTSANADSTTGTPSLTAMDYFLIQIETALAPYSWAVGKVILDNIVVSSGDLLSRFILTAITKTDSINLYLDTTITVTVTEV